MAHEHGQTGERRHGGEGIRGKRARDGDGGCDDGGGRGGGRRGDAGKRRGEGRGRGHTAEGGSGGEKGCRGRDCDGRRRRGRRRERTRDDDGQYAQTIGLDDVRSVFDAVEGPVVTTTDVSDVLGITTESARQKLNALVGEGDCRRRKTGRTVVYWRVGSE